ncbi:thioredoxin family protein [Thalassotalea atypica]|uniref:thioredoxin family protein n=1 Tax=Thalassotalea atypica TaxID=2054316 RepID=UPI002574110A|nr:thioredoxin family protein [Thalassotalea atypica]
MNKIKQYVSALAVLLMISACVSTDSTSKKVEHHVGEITSVSLLKEYDSFSTEYERFQVEQAQISVLESLPKGLALDIYFGTWCHDSHREVPRMLKAMTYTNNIETTLIALDFNKQDPQGLSTSAGIKFTPTFVVKLNGKEIGRIVERPQIDLVTDIKNML